MGQSVLQRSFAAGELDPGLSVRSDLDSYAQGLRTCRNFFVRRSGGVQSRPGLEHVATAKDAAPTFLYAYVFAAADESYVVEAGDHYFRFHHRLRGMVLELATPYPVGALAPTNPLGWHHAGAVVVLTHLDFPPMELRYGGPDVFTLVPASIVPGILPPTDVSGTAGVGGTLTTRYVVTAVKRDSYEESVASAVTELLAAGEPTTATPHQVTWSPVADAVEYKVYRDDGSNNTFGYVGTATGTTVFQDIGAAADYAFTPPLPRLGVMDATLRYPATAAVHQQRRVYAGTHDFRDIVYASRVGLPTNFTHRSPMQDDDTITWRTVTHDLQTIRHLVSLGPLVVLTDRGEWVIRGDSDGGLTPTTIYPEQRGYVGAGWATPVIYGERLLFVQARDTVVRELLINREVEGLSGRDLTPRAAHLFRGHAIRALAFALVPDAILWCVRDDGVLLGLTYIPDEDVLAWHRHDTEGGAFEALVVVPEPLEDAVYVIVNREGVRSVERLGVRDEPTVPLALDRAVRYRGAPTQVVAGLAHLQGRAVRVVADGRALAQQVSAAGTVVLPEPAAVVDVGLPITADLETLELDVAGSDVRDRRKKVTALAILIEDSLQNFAAGPDAAHLRAVRPAPWQSPTARFTGRVELAPTGTFNDEGRVFLRHTEPTTLTVLGVLPVVDVGG